MEKTGFKRRKGRKVVTQLIHKKPLSPAFRHRQKSENDLVSQIMNELPAPLMLVTQQNSISYINKEAERFLGISVDDALDRKWSDVITLLDENGQQIPLQPVEMKKNNHLPEEMGWWLIKTGNGKKIPVQLSVAPIGDAEATKFYGVSVVIHELGEIQHLIDRLRHQCSHDPLTGLVNRSEFERRLVRARDSASSVAKSHTLLFMDLNGFKNVNDKYGHKAGDAMLQNIAGCFRSIVRDRDTLARFGGDEFLLLMEHCDVEHAFETARLLRSALHKTPLHWDGEVVYADVSVGIVVIDQNSPSPEVLITRADAACYVAKKNKSKCIHVFQNGDSECVFVNSDVDLSTEITEV